MAFRGLPAPGRTGCGSLILGIVKCKSVVKVTGKFGISSRRAMAQHLDPTAPLVDVAQLELRHPEQTLWYISVDRNGRNDLVDALKWDVMSRFFARNQSDSTFRSYRRFDGKGSGDFGRRCHWWSRF